jgi:choline dehydrogenase
MAAGSYRYVIVGAGSAGCVLANRLSADPACQVALLEAGGPDRKREFRIPLAAITLFQSAYDWNYRTSKQPQLSDRELYWPRGKTLGGSSSINGMAWVRGHRADYDGWAPQARSSSPSCVTPTRPHRHSWLRAPSWACAVSTNSTSRTTPDMHRRR